MKELSIGDYQLTHTTIRSKSQDRKCQKQKMKKKDGRIARKKMKRGRMENRLGRP